MIPHPQPEYFLISKEEVNFMRTSMFSDRGECRKIMQKVVTRPYQSGRDINMHPCSGCGCMLDDNLGCPEMKICLDYHICKVAEIAKESSRDMVLNELGKQRDRLLKILPSKKCDNNCDDCILCDNAGGCIYGL